MREVKYPGVVLGLTGLTLEILGVSSGAYHYGWQPLKILGVPLSIPMMWSLVGFTAYVLSRRFGVFWGVLGAYSLDLILEPLAYYFNLWTWTSPYTPQIYFGSTVGNLLVWVGMCCLGVILFRSREGD